MIVNLVRGYSYMCWAFNFFLQISVLKEKKLQHLLIYYKSNSKCCALVQWITNSNWITGDDAKPEKGVLFCLFDEAFYCRLFTSRLKYSDMKNQWRLGTRNLGEQILVSYENSYNLRVYLLHNSVSTFG